MEHFGNLVRKLNNFKLLIDIDFYFLGELQYQQDLERRNPKAFKELLERNGIKYDPNYIRGGWNDQ